MKWLVVFLIFQVSACKQKPPPQTLSNIKNSTQSLQETEIDPQMCARIQTNRFLSGTGSPECRHYCESCLGVGANQFEKYFKKFSTIVWAEWWGIWGLNWLTTLAKSLQNPKILSSLKAANIGTCWAIIVIALVRTHAYLEGMKSDKTPYDQNNITRVTCGVIYAMSACTAATKFPPISAALKPFATQITAAMAACSVGEFLGNKIICNATKKSCLGSIENAKPLTDGNTCCCKKQNAWSFEKEHPCRRGGGKFKAGTCGYGLPSEPRECGYIR